QVARRDRVLDLWIVWPPMCCFFQLLERLVDLSVCNQRLRQQPPVLDVCGIRAAQTREERDGVCGVAHLQVNDRQRLQRGARVEGHHHRACDPDPGERSEHRSVVRRFYLSEPSVARYVARAFQASAFQASVCRSAESLALRMAKPLASALDLMRVLLLRCRSDEQLEKRARLGVATFLP